MSGYRQTPDQAARTDALARMAEGYDRLDLAVAEADPKSRREARIARLKAQTEEGDNDGR